MTAIKKKGRRIKFTRVKRCKKRKKADWVEARSIKQNNPELVTSREEEEVERVKRSRQPIIYVSVLRARVRERILKL